VFRALHATFGLSFWWGAVLALIAVIFTLGSPIVMQYLLLFINDPTKPVYEGYLLALGLFLCNILSTFFINQFWNVSMVRHDPLPLYCAHWYLQLQHYAYLLYNFKYFTTSISTI